MPSPLIQAGALPDPSKYAPLFTNRFFTGLWTQRNPLRDAAVPHLYEKFYGGSRFESLLGGSNTELTTRLTLARRAGHSVYNSQAFPQISRFYPFRIFAGAVENIRLMVDCATQVFDGTGPNTKNLIFTKAAAALSSYFQSVGNTLYFGNGADQMKWVQTAKSWAAGASFAQGDFLVDANNNLQVAIGALAGNVINVQITGNVCTLTFSAQAPFQFVPGVNVALSAFATATFLNAQTVTITSRSYNQITFAFTHADYASASDTGTATATTGVTGGVLPTWATVVSAITQDGNQQWICKGSATQKWGIAGATQAPSVINAQRPSPYSSWAANTFYSPSLVILDSNNNQQKLTTAGQTGAGAPVWNVALNGTTADGTAVWTNIGPAAWQANHAYTAGAFVIVTFTYWVTITGSGGTRSGLYQAAAIPLLYPHLWHHPLVVALLLSLCAIVGVLSGGDYTYPVTVTRAFQCTTAGTSGAAQPTWEDGTGATVQDNTVVWTNTGSQNITWASIGANTLVSNASTVIDSNGNLQKITFPGKSGAVAPTWATIQGVTTADNTAKWIEAGPFSGANSGAWLYSFAGRNSVTQAVSTESPVSGSITLAAASMVQVQGQGFSDPQVDIIDIYRTAQGGSTRLLIDQILAPANGAGWSYSDVSPDSLLSVQSPAATAANPNNPAPAGLVNLSYHLGRLWGSVGNTVYYSQGPDKNIGNGNEAFAPLKSFIFPSAVRRLWPTSIGMLVFTMSDIGIILGQGTVSNPFYALGFLDGIGLLNYDAFAVNGSTAYLMTAAKKTISLDPGAGVTEVGFPIGDQFKALYDPTATKIAWHEGSSDDTALYVADGTVGWFRMAATSAPETGTVWSPRAQVVGGCATIASVETAPGQRTLLVGSTGGGPILKRDTAVNRDNGTAFTANAIIGSIVLAQAGQIAEIEFLTLDSVKVGTRPVLGLLLGEISGTFEPLYRTWQDPPLLPAAATLFNDRYVCAQNQKPTYCRHFQLQINWAAEDAHNELLAYAIFGAIHQERR